MMLDDNPAPVPRLASGTGVVLAFGVALALGLGLWLSPASAPSDDASRPQHPRSSSLYRSEEVRFDGEGVSLAGTLTLPQAAPPGGTPPQLSNAEPTASRGVPGVVLVSGAGAQSRDGEVAGHKRLLVIADALTQAGIAVLRVDDRGTGGSTGELMESDYAQRAADAVAALRVLAARPEVDADAVGLLGGSEGSVLAALAGSEEPQAAFLVLFSPVALPGHQVLVEQMAVVARERGVPEAEIQTTSTLVRRTLEILGGGAAPEQQRAALEPVVREMLDRGALPSLSASLSPRLDLQRHLDFVLSPAFREALFFDPRPALRSFRGRILVIAGSRDLQTLPATHLPVLRELWADRPGPAPHIRLEPGLNHLLQPAVTGLPEEYGEVSVTIEPRVLRTVVDWILAGAPGERAPGEEARGEEAT